MPDSAAWTRGVTSLTGDEADFLPRYYRLLESSGILEYLSRPHHSEMRPFDFTLATHADNLGPVLKRSLLVSDTLVLVQNREAGRRGDVLESHEDVDRSPTRPDGVSKRELLIDANAVDAARFLKITLPLIKSGEVIIVPPFSTTETYTGYRSYRQGGPPQGVPLGSWYHIEVDGALEAALNGGAVISNPTSELWESVARHVLHVEIPVIEGISLENYIQVVNDDDSGSYGKARRRMQRSFMAITNQSPFDPYLPKKVEAEVEDALSEMRARSTNTVRTAAVRSTGAGLATIMAMTTALLRARGEDYLSLTW